MAALRLSLLYDVIAIWYGYHMAWLSYGMVVLSLTGDNHNLPIVQLWQLPSKNGNNFLPLELVRRDCHHGDLVSLRIQVNFINDSELVDARRCSGEKVSYTSFKADIRVRKLIKSKLM